MSWYLRADCILYEAAANSGPDKAELEALMARINQLEASAPDGGGGGGGDSGGGGAGGGGARGAAGLNALFKGIGVRLHLRTT